MCWIEYNGVSSQTLGVIVERLPDFHRAQRRVEEYSVPGRSGAVVMDGGGYDCCRTQIRINANGVPLRQIYAWLRGEGWLVSSDEPDYKAYAHMYAQIDDSRFRVQEGGADAAYDSLTIEAVLDPYLRKATETPISLSAPGTFSGDGSDAAEPVITVQGSGDVSLTVNGATVLIDGLDGALTLDCEAGVAYITSGGEKLWAGGMVTLLDGWPKLRASGGSNTVNWSGSLTSVVIAPQWRYL